MRVVILFFGFVFAQAVESSDWVKVASNKSLTVYMDMDSYKYLGNEVRAWFKARHTKPQKLSSKKTYIETKSLWIFDCSSEKAAVIQGAFYSAEGDVVDSYSTPVSIASYEEMIPDSFGEGLYKIACQLVAPLENIPER